MLKQKPFPFSVLILVILVFFHSVGSYYSWYWVYPRFDIIVHIFSGLWVALVLLWLASQLGQINSLKEYKLRSFLIAFISAILIGVIWELVENFSQSTFTQAGGYRLDTAFDIFNDGLGGILAYLYFIKKRRNKDKNMETVHPFYNQLGVIKS